MTDKEINIAIAKSLGWTDIVFAGIFLPKEFDYIGSHPSLIPEGLSGKWIGRIPNYCSDLNAIDSAIRCLDKTVCVKDSCLCDVFVCELEEIFSKSRTEPELWSMFNMVNATARQRAEAYLKTIGEWKE